MTIPLENVQRIVLHGSVWSVARHLAFDFTQASSPPRFLQRLKEEKFWPTAAGVEKPRLQLSLGFSRRGLERAQVPLNVLARFALKSPAFAAGAPLRASSKLGASGRNVPEYWDPAFDFMTLDAVLSLHAMAEESLAKATYDIQKICDETGVRIKRLPDARRLTQPPPGVKADDKAQWIYFGFRDGLSLVAIDGFTRKDKLDEHPRAPRHKAGEFLLGHVQDSGANPWIAGPGVRVWPDKLRPFFNEGSFGVLHQIEQYVGAFDRFVVEQAQAIGIEGDELKAKLCGRYPDGRSPAAARDARPGAAFDYENDGDGYQCPFGSHVRRMNPRGDSVAESNRPRAVLRRGMPYDCKDDAAESGLQRGLIGHFFCASIEDQFEHLLGQWADRVPIGSGDRGAARDPLVGAHELGDGAFEIPRVCQNPLMVTGLRPFTRTRGTAYLFYPGLFALDGIADSSLWGAVDEDDE